MVSERALLERVSYEVDLIELKVNTIESTVSAIKEVTDTKFDAISDQIDNSLKIHMLLKEEHEKHLQVLTDKVECNTRFRNNVVGAIKLTAWLTGITFAIAGVYIALYKSLI